MIVVALTMSHETNQLLKNLPFLSDPGLLLCFRSYYELFIISIVFSLLRVSRTSASVRLFIEFQFWKWALVGLRDCSEWLPVLAVDPDWHCQTRSGAAFLFLFVRSLIKKFLWMNKRFWAICERTFNKLGKSSQKLSHILKKCDWIQFKPFYFLHNNKDFSIVGLF